MKQIKAAVHILTLLSLVVVSLAWTFQPAKAVAEIQVNTPEDENGSNSNACSLREAIISANENIAFGGCKTSGTPGTDFIRVPASTRSYALTQSGEDNAARTGDLDIREPVQIFGAPENPPTVSAGTSRDRVFHILTNGSVLFKDLRITGGDYVNRGGGIYVDDDRRVGGGFYKATVTLTRVDLLGNHAADSGGGLVVATGSTAYISYSEVSNNTASLTGGILNEGTMVVDSSLIVQNKGTGGTGGITANSQGENEKTRIINSTITQNDAPDGSGAGVTVSSFSVLELLNVSIVDNRGIGLEVKPGGEGSVKNTIIARQKDDVSKPDCFIDRAPLFQSGGYNMTSDSSCPFAGPGEQLAVSLDRLGVAASLAENGGPTMTYALIDTSPAVDAGDPTIPGGCPASDQRLLGRPAVGRSAPVCDIGSFELNGAFFGTFFPFVRR